MPRPAVIHWRSPAAMADFLRGSPTKIVALNTSFVMMGQSAETREALLEYVPWAEACGVPWLRVFDGKPASGTEGFADLTLALAWWRDLRNARGWRTNLMIETHDSLVSTATLSGFRAAAPDAAILWDAHNTWRKGGEHPCALWPAIARQVVHLHVKDSVNRPSARHPFTYTLPGDGEFPAAALFAMLRENHYGGFVSLEWERHWHPYLPPLSEALNAAQRRHWW